MYSTHNEEDLLLLKDLFDFKKQNLEACEFIIKKCVY